MNYVKFTIIILAILSIMLLPTAIALNNDELVVIVPKTIDSLNPFISRTRLGWAIATLVTDTILKPSNSFYYYYSVKPWIVVKWAHRNNYTTWILRLNNKLSWSDGTPVNSRDLMFTLCYLRDQNIPPWSLLLRSLTSIKIINETSAMINFSTPAPYLLRLLVAIPLINEKEVEGLNLARIRYFNITLGPYHVVEYTDDRIVLAFNNRYSIGEIPYKRIVFLLSNDSEKAYDLLMSNKVDVVIDLISPFRIKDFINNQAYRLVISPGLSLFMMVLNNKNPYLRDIAFRYALRLCLNMTKIRVEVFNNYVDITRTYIPLHFFPPKGIPDYIDVLKDYGIDINYNLTSAQELLKSLGYADYNNDGIFEDFNRNEIVLTLVSIKGDPVLENVAKVLANEIRNLGVKMHEEFLEANEFINRVYVLRDFDIALIEVPYFIFPSPEFIALMAISEEYREGGISLVFSNSDFLSLKTLHEYNLTAKLEETLDLEGILYAESNYIPLFNRPIIEISYKEKVPEYSMIYGLLAADSLVSIGKIQRGWNIPFSLIKLMINVAIVIVGLVALYSAIHIVESGYLMRILRP